MTFHRRSLAPGSAFAAEFDRAYLWLARRARALPALRGAQPLAAFLVGSGRSGTDLLAHCLGQSTWVQPVNEDNPAAFANWRLRDLETLRAVVAGSSARLVLFKPIVETMRIGELLDQFEGARALFLFRNYRDSINSRSRFFGDRQLPIIEEWMADDFLLFPGVASDVLDTVRQAWRAAPTVDNAAGIYWLLYNLTYEVHRLGSDPRVMLVDYDRFVLEPAIALEKVTRFLGVPFRSAMIRQVKPGSVGKSRPPVLEPSIERLCEETWLKLRSAVL